MASVPHSFDPVITVQRRSLELFSITMKISKSVVTAVFDAPQGSLSVYRCHTNT